MSSSKPNLDQYEKSWQIQTPKDYLTLIYIHIYLVGICFGRYSLVANITASSYAVISTLIVLATRNGVAGFAQAISIFDATIVGLLFSANGAALAVGIIGYKGNSHLQWNKVCNVFDSFCDRVAISIVLSLIASFAFITLVALAVLSLQKRFATRT